MHVKTLISHFYENCIKKDYQSIAIPKSAIHLELMIGSVLACSLTGGKRSIGLQI